MPTRVSALPVGTVRWQKYDGNKTIGPSSGRTGPTSGSTVRWTCSGGRPNSIYPAPGGPNSPTMSGNFA